MQYVLLVRYTQQVSEDGWERKSKIKIIESTTTVEEIFEWARKEGIDNETIQILPNSH